MNDEQLVEECIKGDIEAFDALVVRYQKEVFYLVRGLVMDIEEAKDITQKTFIKAFRRLKKLRNRKKFRQWLLSIAINTAKDSLRSVKTSIMEPPNVVDCKADPEEETIKKEQKRLLLEAIGSLSTRQKEVVLLRIYHGLRFHEIAEMLNITPESVRTSFHFGIKNLSKTLREKGYEV
jgi:RNA polymerase sigma-70 factor (ECF subfamily)